LFHLKNRLKTRVALIELLDLSGIAVGNVGVPTCLILKACGCQLTNERVFLRKEAEKAAREMESFIRALSW
jgi:hypothetical protein